MVKQPYSNNYPSFGWSILNNKLSETKKRRRDQHLFGVSLDLPLQTRCRFDCAVLRARSPRQVITPG